jgi:tRNA A37 threonylcarbamoyladenosine synthetase subunit TsaC/SUA5/YrdC
LQELLSMHGAPLLATTLIAPGETEPLNEPQEIRSRFEHDVAGVIDAGACASTPTTVVDLSGEGIEVVRLGRGALSVLGL